MFSLFYWNSWCFLWRWIFIPTQCVLLLCDLNLLKTTLENKSIENRRIFFFLLFLKFLFIYCVLRSPVVLNEEGNRANSTQFSHHSSMNFGQQFYKNKKRERNHWNLSMNVFGINFLRKIFMFRTWSTQRDTYSKFHKKKIKIVSLRRIPINLVQVRVFFFFFVAAKESD